MQSSYLTDDRLVANGFKIEVKEDSESGSVQVQLRSFTTTVPGYGVSRFGRQFSLTRKKGRVYINMQKWQLHRLARIKKVETWSMEKTFRDVQLVLGKVVEFPNEKEAKVRVIKNAFDEWLKMYFKKRQDYHAAVEGHQCKIGDMVLIRQLPSRLTVDITHAVEKVVYRLGEVVDPLTEKPVSAVRYKEHLEEIRAITLGEKKPDENLVAKAAAAEAEDGNVLKNVNMTDNKKPLR